MDQPDSAKPDTAPDAVVVDEVRSPMPSEQSGHKAHAGARDHRAPTHAPRLPGLLTFGAVLFGIAAFAFSGWIYSQNRQEILRLSTDLAELRVSLELYTRNGGESGSLAALEGRLSEIEDSMAGTSVPTPATASPTPDPASSDQDQDCLPVGMRLLVASGDAYAVCGQPGTVEVSVVDNGYITLADGTSVPSGGSMPLPGSPCMIAVTSGGDEGLTGYAEIRVSC